MEGLEALSKARAYQSYFVFRGMECAFTTLKIYLSIAQKKHGPICQKTSAKKRKTFDSSRQRAEGTDIPTVKPLKPRPEPPKKPSNWRRKHEEFIATIRAAKGLNLKDGGKLPPPPPPSYDPDYIQCPYCQRRFNENAADRHINFCKEQAARITNKGKLAADTKGKVPTRSQYKPAAVKKMPSAVSAPPSSSRLPQPSGVSKTVVGSSSTKALSSSGSSVSKIQSLSPAHKTTLGMVNPQAGMVRFGKSDSNHYERQVPIENCQAISKMDKLGPPLRTGRGVQRFYDTDTKTDITIKRPNELLPIKNDVDDSSSGQKLLSVPAENYDFALKYELWYVWPLRMKDDTDNLICYQAPSVLHVIQLRTGLMVKLGMTLLTAYPQSMEEVQKAVKEIHLYSYLNFAMNVGQGIQWNGRSSAVSVEFEEWLCECV
ncbi:UNVERIFIED_CONTAM: hypothetical protein H355_011639 [Colinus virginianus]|nr:hypothetical protein H355_011639 [Colinus virginianus]